MTRNKKMTDFDIGGHLWKATLGIRLLPKLDKVPYEGYLSIKYV